MHEWSFEAIGTSWWIGIYQQIPQTTLNTLREVITQRIEVFDKTYSRFREDSLVTAIAQAAGTYEFPTDADELFAFYRQFYDISDGLVTPLIGQTLSDAGYDAGYSLKSRTMDSPPAWADVMKFDKGKLETRQPVLLDFGAAGKGYLVDLVSNLLKEQGVSQFCVDAGGDMFCRGLETPMQIGLENPDDFNQVVGVASLTQGALCASAGNRRKWGKFHHVIDPQRLESPQHIKAVWVIANSAMLADGMTTALYFVEPEKLRQKFQFEYLIIDANNQVKKSAGFPAGLFI
jgi:thiamine biosynthesis lipoprotein